MQPPNVLISASKKAAKAVLRATWFRKDVLRPRREEKPFLVRLDVNNSCNMLCDKCFYPDFVKKNIPPHRMSVDEYRLLASRLFEYAYGLQMACAFESLLHPQYVEMLEITDRYDIPFVGMVTNGSLLTGEKARAIARSKTMKVVSISLDAVSPGIFEKVRGKPFLDAVLRNVEDFQEMRRSAGKPYPVLNVNARIMRSNLRDLPRLLEWCGERGIEKAQFFHVFPFAKENDESAIHVPLEYNAVREELLALARKYPVECQIPPPLDPERPDSETGNGILPDWVLEEKPQPSGAGGPGSGAPGTPGAPGAEVSLPYPYPRGVFCICPWMLVSVDCYGDLRPCGRRFEDVYGNILRQDLNEAMNSIKILKLRRAIRKDRREAACLGCRRVIPHAEPMTDRLPGISF